MHDIFLLPTDTTPLAIFESSGNFTLQGRSLISDINKFYQPIIEWVNQLETPSVRFNIDIDYYNTASAKKLLELLRTIDNNDKVQEFEVIWHFEEDDEDTLEKGQLFEERLKKARFTYKELIET